MGPYGGNWDRREGRYPRRKSPRNSARGCYCCRSLKGRSGRPVDGISNAVSTATGETVVHGSKTFFIKGEDRTAEVHQFAERIGLDSIIPGRYSSHLLGEMFVRSDIFRTQDPYAILDQIKNLEGVGRRSFMKPGAPFKHPPLKGLMHQHYMVNGIASMAQNLMVALKRYGIPTLEQSLAEAEASGVERTLTVQDINRLAHDVVMGNYERRANAQELTGEWIVYAQHQGANYYLCLGRHDSGDDHLRAQIDLICVPEFPFLSTVLCPLPPAFANSATRDERGLSANAEAHNCPAATVAPCGIPPL